MSHKRYNHQIKLQAAQIERILSQQEIDGEVVRASLNRQNGRRTTQFDIAAHLASSWRRLQSLQQELVQSMRQLDVRLTPQGNDNFRIDVTETSEPPVDFFDLLEQIDPLPPLTAALGWSADDLPVLLDLNLPHNHHVLIAGIAGAGKTTLLRTIITSLALHNRPAQVQFLLAAPTEQPGGMADARLAPFNYLPHMLWPVMGQAEDVREAITFLLAECRFRLANTVGQPAIFLFIDNLHLLLHRPDDRLAADLARLAREGGRCGIHLVVTTRFPDHPALYDLLETHIPSRIAGRMASSEQAEIATDALESGAERLLGEGDFLAAVGDELLYFQAALLHDYDLHYTLEQLHHTRPPALVAQPLVERPAVKADTPQSTFTYFPPRNNEAVDLLPTPPPKNEAAAAVTQQPANPTVPRDSASKTAPTLSFPDPDPAGEKLEAASGRKQLYEENHFDTEADEYKNPDDSPESADHWVALNRVFDENFQPANRRDDDSESVSPKRPASPPPTPSKKPSIPPGSQLAGCFGDPQDGNESSEASPNLVDSAQVQDHARPTRLVRQTRPVNHPGWNTTSSANKKADLSPNLFAAPQIAAATFDAAANQEKDEEDPWLSGLVEPDPASIREDAPPLVSASHTEATAGQDSDLPELKYEPLDD